MQHGYIDLGRGRCLAEDGGSAFLKPVLPFRNLVRMHVEVLCESVKVLSPLRAAKATFDLKAAVWFRRRRLLICSPRFAILGGWGTGLPLIPLSEFPRPPQ